MSSSRFVAEFASVRKAEAAVSRFLASHPKVSRFIARIPGASKFLPLPTIVTAHVAPVYNTLARKQRGPTFRM